MSDRPLRLVVFDLDGTLVDSQHHIVAAMEYAFDAVSLPRPPADEVRGVIGLSLEVAIERLMCAPDPGLVSRARQAYVDAFRGGAVPGTETLFEGARETVEALDAAGYLLAVATGKGQRGLRQVLTAHGLIDRFVSLQSADQSPSKPDPTMLRRALDEAGVEANGAVMVGDTTYDMEMARNAGVASIAVDWGYHDTDRLMAVQPDAMIGHFDQLAATVDRLLYR